MKFHSPFAFAAVAVTALALSACSGAAAPQSDEKPDKLIVMITNSPSAGALQASAPGFTKETGIEIEFVDVPYDQLGTKLVLTGQSNTSTFDIAQLDGASLASIVPAGGLLPLDDFIAADSSYDIDDFPESLQDYSKFDDTTYGIPFGTEPYVQFYRTDLYEQAGITPATTWEELNANAKAVTALGNGTYGYAGPYGALGSGEPFTERLYASGGRVFDPDSGEPLLNSDLAKRVMTEYIDLVPDSPEATVAGHAGDSAIQFTQFPVGLNVAPSGWWGTLNDPEASTAAGVVGVASVPLATDGDFEAKNILRGWLIGVSAQSQHQQAAWDFLSYALSKDNVQTFIDAGAPLVGRTSTLTNADYQEQLPYLEYLEPTIVDGTALPAIAEWPEIQGLISQHISLIVTQGAPVDATMDDLNEAVRTILVDSGRLDS
jgi:ABC-type glycerol-3-phosphate transport system substrate-binding protein